MDTIDLSVMVKWNILVVGSDGKKFYQNFHVIEASSQAAANYLLQNFPDARIKKSVRIQKIEELEKAGMLLPGIVYKSGRAYFSSA